MEPIRKLPPQVPVAPGPSHYEKGPLVNKTAAAITTLFLVTVGVVALVKPILLGYLMVATIVTASALGVWVCVYFIVMSIMESL
jgi:hypothetical protein